MGDVEYSIGRDPGAKGGVGVMVTLWPGGVVPYVLDTCLRDPQKRNVERAMRRWEEVAPVRIREQWDQGRKITDLAFGEGQWYLVATKSAGIGMWYVVFSQRR